MKKRERIEMGRGIRNDYEKSKDGKKDEFMESWLFRGRIERFRCDYGRLGERFMGCSVRYGESS